MAGFIKNICKISILTLVVPGLLMAAQQQNPRGATSARSAARSADSASSAAIRRSATSVIARSTSGNSRAARAVVTARPNAVRSASVRSVRPVVKNSSAVRAATKASLVRSGTKQKVSGANVSRAGTARATAVFNDISKIGGGYANCRDSYATCMDQFCALANDTYRRCFCSDKFADFREMSDRMDSALQMLAEFQDNNLNAVDKTAAEVDAMYSSTAGEEAIKKDESASRGLLNSIGDLLSGKTSAVKQKKTTSSLGVLDFSSFGGSDDIFGGGSSLFDTGSSSAVDMSTLEGKELYDSAAKQCVEITRDACSSDAMFNLARSAYTIMITQDCNMYEKNINTKKASIEETVRTANKYLMDARLEEYRSHNSADVIECLEKVEKAIRQPIVCGENYERCMDYTGLYIDTEGNPIYSQALFGLNNLIVLDGTADVLGANAQFNKMLDDKRKFAETALDTCRDNADTVWYEFKRSAIIQIAQSQDKKIQDVKDSCVETIKQCYDKQSGALKSIDDTELQSTGAIVAVTARGMCYDRVQACAALYGDPNGCVYDDATKKLTPVSGKKCGLQSLLAFVDTVDSVKVAEGCEAALTKYADELCPKTKRKELDANGNVVKDENGDDKYSMDSDGNFVYDRGGVCLTGSKDELRAAMNNRMEVFCAHDLVNSDESNTLQQSSVFNTNIMNQIIKNIYDEMGIAFTIGCEEMGGAWVRAGDVEAPVPEMLIQEFYTKYYGRKVTTAGDYVSMNLTDKGWCVSADRQNQCLDLGEEYTTGLDNDGSCKLTDYWFNDMCIDLLGGRWDGNKCIVDNITQENVPGGGISVAVSSDNTSSSDVKSSVKELATKLKNSEKKKSFTKVEINTSIKETPAEPTSKLSFDIK